MRLLLFALVVACTGDDVIDADSDGSPAGVDCDDNDASVNPSALETCDGRDEDCDGDIDEGAVGGTWTLVEGEVASAAGTEILSLAAGDVDGDGDLDLLAMDAAAATVNLLSGGGDGSLATGIAFAAGTEPAAVTAGDVDGDDLADVVVADYGAKAIVTLKANGAGGLRAPSASPEMTNPPNVVALANFDGGGLDVAWSANGDGGVSLGDGDGTFAAWVSEPLASALGVAVADFDDDDHLDLAVGGYGGSVMVVLLDADGVKSVHTVPAPDGVTEIAAADLDGDEHPDVVAVSDLGDIEAFLGQGDGTLVSAWTGSASTELYYIDLGDIDGDDIVDLVVGGMRLDLFRGIGDGTFGNAVALTDDVVIGGVIVADFTNDGDEDIAYVTADGDTAIFTATLVCD